ncbi:MAG: hypothetical protein JJ872_10565 [Marivivens sp.]|nr:hypothetical protein [Marivivens sp.]
MRYHPEKEFKGASSGPLQVVEKLQAIAAAAASTTGLKAGELKVFIMLVFRQNPETGRCDPTVARLQIDTGLAERTVREAFKVLERKKLIVRTRKSNWSRNHIGIMRADPAVLEAIFSRLQRPGWQKSAENPTEDCRENRQRSAPRKGKIKYKEKGKGGGSVSDYTRTLKHRTTNCSDEAPLGMEEFEKRVQKYFEKAGRSYEDLLKVDRQFFEYFRQYHAGKIGFLDACRLLVQHSKEN